MTTSPLPPADTQWPDGWSAHRWRLALPVPAQAGRWLSAAGLFAQGRDFTNGRADLDPAYEGHSLLKDLWAGQTNRATAQAVGLDVWVLQHEGRPAGVIAWTRHANDGAAAPVTQVPEVPDHPRHRPKSTLAVAHLGMAMLYLKPEHRGQGVMRRALAACMVPALVAQAERARQDRAMPILAATDATATLLDGLAPVPLVNELAPCVARDRAVWGFWTRSHLWSPQPRAQDRYVVAPTAIAPERRAKARLAPR